MLDGSGGADDLNDFWPQNAQRSSLDLVIDGPLADRATVAFRNIVPVAFQRLAAYC